MKFYESDDLMKKSTEKIGAFLFLSQ